MKKQSDTLSKAKSAKKLEQRTNSLRNAAWELLARRRELRELMSQKSDASDLSFENQKRIQKLLNIIDNKKRFLEKRNVSVSEAIQWAKKNPREKAKKAHKLEQQLKAARPPKRHSGVGVYDLNGPKKIWTE